MRAKEIAEKAAEIVAGDRESEYGDKLKNHENIAALWNAYLSIRREPAAPLSPLDICLMMDLLKTARAAFGNPSMDTFIDKAGYSACAGEVYARSTLTPTGDGG